ncbi:MAG: hypothetical protein PUC44_01700, partial [Eubacteriales bacterium]|nr:hypothetical protein [Eubacteriales bacterium]
MIKRHYTGKTRRSLNMIWNAAGSYDFEPPFQAFFPNGEPDLYYDMVIGFTAKWFSMDKITAFFDRFQAKPKRDEYDALLWLGIEHCVYEKEKPERPILPSLRKQRAQKFYSSMGMLSRQQMMLMSTPVYTQKEYRAAEVLGKKAPSVSPREKEMAESLRFPGTLDEDGLLDAMRNFLIKYFRYDCVLHPAYEKETTGITKAFYEKVLRREQKRTDSLFIRNMSPDQESKAHLLDHSGQRARRSQDPEKDEAYIRSIFGAPLYSQKEMRILENDLCKGKDADCRLYLAGAGGASRESADASGASGSSSRGERLFREIRAQQSENHAWFQKNIFAIQENIRKLSSETDTIFSSFKRQLPERAKSGKLISSRTYRLPVLHDPSVFEKPGTDSEFEIQIDLLLDASMSRMKTQETIAAQAYIIAKSFAKAHIPVRVLSFRSLRGYTVLQELKASDSRDCEGLLNYFSGGWNRDSLALRTVGHLILDEEKQVPRQHILLVLTDASPNDSTPLNLSEEDAGTR